MMDSMHHDNSNGFQMPQISTPPLMNPPPQIFGGYSSADGLPMPSNMVDLSQPIFGDGTLLDESNEAKRRRIARVGYPAALGGWRMY
jgi:hypothetical protein